MTLIFNSIIAFLEKIGLIFNPALPPEFSSGGEPFYISFEGLGIGQFKINPIAIPVGNGIRFYGIIITVAIVLAFLYVAKWRAKDCGYHFDDLLDFVLFVVPIGVLGARLFYVFTYDGMDLADWYKIWDGGLAIYGGVIAGALTILGVGIYKKVRILRLMDCTAPAVMIAQALGRWGNFFNGEAFGAETSSFMRMGLSHIKGGAQVYVHPTFLYESLWNVLGFILINLTYKKKKFDGQITLEYLGWYGLGRFFIELLRQDSLPLTIGSYNLRISSVIGMLCFLVALILLIVFLSKKRSPKLDEPCYYPGAKRLALIEAEKAKAESASETESMVGGSVPEEVTAPTQEEPTDEEKEDRCFQSQEPPTEDPKEQHDTSADSLHSSEENDSEN